MRTSWIGGLLTLLLAAPTMLWADPQAKYVATLTRDIQVQSGASWQYMPTGKLRKGERVFANGEDNGWLAIMPPPGSVSWVNHLFLGEYDSSLPGKQNAVIMKDDVQVRVGSDLKSGPLPVKQVTLPRGTIVTIVGPKMRFEDSTWYPIEPPAQEYRWIPRDAVGALELAPPPPVVTRNPQAVEPDPKTSPVTTAAQQRPAPDPAAAANTAASHPSWAKAEQAEQNGDWNDAERFYTEVYTSLRKKNGDIDQLLACYNRIDRCRERKRNASIVPMPTPGGGNTGGRGDGRGPVSLSPPADKPLEGYPVNSSPAPERSTSAVPSNAALAPGEPKTSSTGPGFLRKAPFFIDNRQAYALEGSGGRLLYYVTANGVGLDPHLNRQVELVGMPQVRGDIRGAQYMVVTKVIPLN